MWRLLHEADTTSLLCALPQGQPIIEGRPGASIEAADLEALRAKLQRKWGKMGEAITERDVISAALYPAVFDEYRKHVADYSELTADLSSNAFFHAMEEDEEVELVQDGGNAITIKFKVRRPIPTLCSTPAEHITLPIRCILRHCDDNAPSSALCPFPLPMIASSSNSSSSLQSN